MDIAQIDITRPVDPEFLDRKIWLLIDELALLSYKDVESNSYLWFTKLFPLVERDKNNNPVLYSSDSIEYLSMLPNDNIKSYGFFIENAQRNKVGLTSWTASVSFYVFFNEQQISSSNYRLQEYFISAIDNLFSNNPQIKNISLSTQPLDVFSDFNISSIEQTLRPFNSFRFDFSIDINVSCPIEIVGDKPIC
jgi:hypothetical protein